MVTAAVTAGTLLTTTIAGTTVSTTTAMAAGERLSRVVLVDDPGDVRRWVEEDQGFTAGANRPEVDFLRTVVAHGKRQLRVRMRFRDLDQYGTEERLHVEIHTREGRWFHGSVTIGPDNWSGEYLLRDDTDSDDIPKPVRCARDSFNVDYTRDLVIMRIPRPCLGRPTWVEVRIGGILDDPDPDPWLATVYSDQPHSSRLSYIGYTPHLFRRTS